jgi:putative aminopeptidase FrvX
MSRRRLASFIAVVLILPLAAGFRETVDARGAQAAGDATIALLAELTNAHAAPGFEGPVRDILRREWKGLLADLRTDGLGNLLGSLQGTSEGPRVLLMAHMDEVGFLVRHIDEDGFIYVNNVGGYFSQSVLTQRLTIMTPRGPVLGYTGMKSGHILRPEERERMVPLSDMFIDIGARSREEAMETFGVRPGLPVTYQAEFEVLNGTTRYLAKAWNDRVGLAIITEVLRPLKGGGHPNTVQVAATVQEEIGLRGAAVVEASTHPDIVINFEIGVAADFPLLTSPTLAQEALGKGPSIFVFDGSMIPNNRFVEWTLAQAERHGIPIQFESITGFGEDGSMLQRSARGIPTVNLGVPTRYAHSQSGVIDRADYDHAVKLVLEMVRALDQAAVASIRSFE